MIGNKIEKVRNKNKYLQYVLLDYTMGQNSLPPYIAFFYIIFFFFSSINKCLPSGKLCPFNDLRKEDTNYLNLFFRSSIQNAINTNVGIHI